MIVRPIALPQGWMSGAERTWLRRAGARVHGLAVEVGSWKGRSTLCLTQSMRRGRLYAVDTWAGVPDDPMQQERLYKDVDPQALFKEFSQNLAHKIAMGRVRPLRMTSLEGAAHVLKRHGPGSLDLVFIDADHRYEAVKADIEAWAPLVRDGGMLCGHDYHWEGVRDAVCERLPGHRPGSGTIWTWRVR